MKRLSYMMIALLGAGAVFLSCQKDGGGDSGGKELADDVTLKSVSAYSENEERGRDIFDISLSTDRKTITFTTRALPVGETPVDMTKVHISMSFASGATSDISEEPYDLTKTDNAVTVTAEDGETTTIIALVGIVTPPYEVIPQYKTTVSEVWTKTGTELVLKGGQSSMGGIAVAREHLLIMDHGVDHNPDNYRIKVYDKMTGDFVTDVAVYEGGWWGVPGYMGAIAADEAGNFGNSRIDEAGSGAGFWVDFYTATDTYISTIVPMVQGELSGFGRRLQFLGDLTGSGKIISTNGSIFGANLLNAEYVVFNVSGGTPSAPSKFAYGSNLQWTSAFVQQASMDDPTLYVSYNDESNYPNDPQDTWETAHAGHFQVYNPSSGEPARSIADENFMYRILNHHVFTLKERTFLFTLEQSYSTAGAMGVKLFDITDANNYDMKPGDEGYDKFLVFASETTAITNDHRHGNVTTWVDAETGTAYLAVYYPAGPTTINIDATTPFVTDAKVVIYKVETERIQ